jgi:phenylpropionate dioxygenase-like ring-hydroxylating dioxygenase large terminal subunit
MGNLMRQYWVPALPSAEFPEPDGAPKRMKLLGENLVMFRNSSGQLGCVAEACPHRGASMFFGRNEENGLRCVYHGWKFDVTGQCVDMPNEPAESNFKHKIQLRAYPCRDVNHMVWVYMGDRATPPPFPAFEVNTLPAENVAPPVIMMEESNWLQNIEGDLDSAHLDFLHSRLTASTPTPPGQWSVFTGDKNPRMDVVPTDYGVFYTAKRTRPDGQEWHRINQFVFPFHTMITGSARASLRSFVPLDDEWAMLISQSASLDGPIPEAERNGAFYTDPFKNSGGFVTRTSDPHSYFYTVANKHNDYHRDYEIERKFMMTGIPNVMNLQDRAMTEPMKNAAGETIYDRFREHLGTSDGMVITVRRSLIRAARNLRDTGTPPPNVDDQLLNRVRHATVMLPPGADWVKATETARNADSGAPVAQELKEFSQSTPART